jgi:hypothetical protein
MKSRSGAVASVISDPTVVGNAAVIKAMANTEAASSGCMCLPSAESDDELSLQLSCRGYVQMPLNPFGPGGNAA